MAVVGPEISYAEFMGEMPPSPPLRTLTLLKIRIPRLPNPLLVDIHHSSISGGDVFAVPPNEPKPPRYLEVTFPVYRLASVARLALAKLP